MWNLLLFLASCFVLIKSAQVLVHSLGKIADFFKISEFSAGFALMAVATSLPELFVCVIAAFQNVPSLALGNIFGSNIADLTLVIGIVVLVSGGFWLKKEIAERDAVYMLFFAAAPIFLLLDGSLSRGDAVVLLLFYGMYLSMILRRKATRDHTAKVTREELWRSLFYFAVAIIFLLASSQGIVFSARGLATSFRIPLSLIGLFAVALGTSLPELAFELKAVKNHGGMVIGDLMGSVVTNSTLVLALTSLVRPISVKNLSVYLSSVVFLGVILILFSIFVRTDRELDTGEGLVLLFLYIIFLIIEFGIGFVAVR